MRHSRSVNVPQQRLSKGVDLEGLLVTRLSQGDDRCSAKMAPMDAPVKLTYSDFLLFLDDGKRHELIDGDHYVTPSPNLRHQTISGRLHYAITAYLEVNPIGLVWAAPLDVVLSHHDVVEPNLIYVSNGRAPVLTKQNIKGAPDLAVEILSPGTRKTDEVIKRRAYERRSRRILGGRSGTGSGQDLSDARREVHARGGALGGTSRHPHDPTAPRPANRSDRALSAGLKSLRRNRSCCSADLQVPTWQA